MTASANSKKVYHEEIVIWKDIEGFKGYYQINNFGMVKRLKSKAKSFNGHKHCEYDIPERILKSNLNNRGYEYIELNVGGKSKCVSIHRLLAEAFIPNPENKPQVNHKNGIKHDNRIENLEWCTAKENSSHAWDNGLTVGKSGEENANAKLSIQCIYKIRKIHNTGLLTQKQIAKAFDVGQTTISEIVRNKRWNEGEIYPRVASHYVEKGYNPEVSKP